ncbi:hypothetical protein N7452_001600 [Penicillium brevicompactum]|uniref:Uncharacterized protein n=1 Tax=Penicillium brevicompactum TaxID=5074 RepID=A0A9W9R2V5_PENBR|nr:hypothetical protein N7452_001600 [Penicillium brevicompactum]
MCDKNDNPEQCAPPAPPAKPESPEADHKPEELNPEASRKGPMSTTYQGVVDHLRMKLRYGKLTEECKKDLVFMATRAEKAYRKSCENAEGQGNEEDNDIGDGPNFY